MVARQQKKGFKTTVSIVSSNVLQKVVTIKNSCSHSTTNPSSTPAFSNKKQVPAQVHIQRNSLRDDLCCSPPIPLTITILGGDEEEDTTSEISCDAFDLDRPPTPRPKSIRKQSWSSMCLVESSIHTTTCGIPTLPTMPSTNSNMDWPSDEEQEEESKQVEESPQKLSSVCGFDFWTPPSPNRWGLLIADRDEHDEGRVCHTPVRRQREDDEDGVLGARTFSGSTYEYREPMVTFHADTSPFYTP